MGMLSKRRLKNKKVKVGLPLLPGLEGVVGNGQMELGLDATVLKGVPDAQHIMALMLHHREKLAELMTAYAFCKHLFPQPEDDGVVVVQKVVARVCRVNVLRVYVSARGNSDEVTARQIGMHICFKRGLGCKSALARRFNRLDHGTVIHACDTVEERLEDGVDPKFKALYEECVLALEPFTLKALVELNNSPVPKDEEAAMKS